MNMKTLTDVHDLGALMHERDVLIVDCRFDLADPARGARDYAQGHIPGAVYADLNRDLSDLSKRGLGRHPLPEANAFSAVLGRWGWTPGTPVVAYDEASGAHAARLWWMLRLIGACDVAVLDGGLAAWKTAGLPLDTEIPARSQTDVAVEFDRSKIVYTAQLQQMLQNAQFILLDARAAPRFRGEVEPIDPVAGHVPGALNRPFSENLAADGRFKPAATLRAEFQTLLGIQAPSEVINMCGSGVTACHNLLAMEHAGLPGARVYAPSWSGWTADSTRPVAAVPK
jgi:thiosulfate/3-mercaptopyruvate sulfurtransferase